MNPNMQTLFDTEMLIRDLIVEDQFNAKYTKNQKSIFCKNMYAKISNFLQRREEEVLDRLNRRYLNQQQELEETKRQLEQYRLWYQRNSYNGEFANSILNILLMIYFYYYIYQWITTTTLTDQS